MDRSSPSARADLLDAGTEARRPLWRRRSAAGCVPGADLREPALAGAAAVTENTRPVVDEAVHEHHRDARGQRVAAKGAGAGGQVAGSDARIGRSSSVRVPSGYMSRCARPGQFGQAAGHRRAGAEGAQTAPWRSLGEGAGVRRWEGSRTTGQPHRSSSPVVTRRRRPGRTARRRPCIPVCAPFTGR